MLTVPVALMALIVSFAPLFSKRVWQHAQVLLVGAILAPGKRTVTSALRVCGLAAEPRYQNYHRVLNRAAWSPLEASRHLLGLLLQTFAPTVPLLFGLDDTTPAAARRQDQRQGHLSRPGPLLARAHSPRQWVALAVLYVAPRDRMGRAHLGIALLDRTAAPRSATTRSGDVGIRS